MPRGDEEEMAVRGVKFFRFFARVVARALPEQPTLIPSLIRNSLRPDDEDFRYCPPGWPQRV
jgi:hypothetical protein